jgi:4-hydroxybenzoate polyprenyltransferase
MIPSLLERLFRAAERRQWTLGLALATPTWIAVVRMLLERELSVGPVPLGRPPFPWFAHIVVFYLALSVCLTALLARMGRVPWRAAAGQVSLGLTLGTVPPLIDVGVYGIGRFSYEYQPAVGALPWTLHQPPAVLPWGETIVLWLTIALMTLAGVRARAGWARVVGLALGTWALILLFLVLLPAGCVFLSQAQGLAPSEWRNALFGVVTFAGAVVATGTERRLARRTLHVLLAPVLLLLGAALRGRLDGAVTLGALHFALLSAGFALANDFYDRVEDAAAGRPPAPDEASAQLLAVVPLVPVLHVLAFRLELALSLVGFAVVSFAYHADPLRLKCVFPLSYKTEGFLGGLAFFAGLSAAQPALLTPAQLWAAALVTLGTPVALVFKDWKDVDGDRAAGVRTAFVVLEAAGLPRDRVRWGAAALLVVALGTVALGVQSWTGGGGALLGALALAAAAPVALLPRPRLSVALSMGLAEAQLLAAAWLLWRARPGP